MVGSVWWCLQGWRIVFLRRRWEIFTWRVSLLVSGWVGVGICGVTGLYSLVWVLRLVYTYNSNIFSTPGSFSCPIYSYDIFFYSMLIRCCVCFPRSIWFQNCLLSVWNWLVDHYESTGMVYGGMGSSRMSWGGFWDDHAQISSSLKPRHSFSYFHVDTAIGRNFIRLYWFIIYSGMYLNSMRAYSYFSIVVP